jgi:hypothetical protein
LELLSTRDLVIVAATHAEAGVVTRELGNAELAAWHASVVDWLIAEVRRRDGHASGPRASSMSIPRLSDRCRADLVTAYSILADVAVERRRPAIASLFEGIIHELHRAVDAGSAALGARP